MEFRKMVTMAIYARQQKRHRYKEQTVGLCGRRRGWFLPYIDMNQPWVYMCSPSWPPSHLPPHPIPLGHPSAPALSTLPHALNLDWWCISHMIIYMFQCYFLKSSHPRLLPQSPKVCSLYLCLLCSSAYRIVSTIFLDSIYMH